MTRTEELRGEIVETLARAVDGKAVMCGFVADQILATCQKAGLAFVVKDAELPESLYHEEEYLDPKWVEEAVKNDMLKAGFRQTKEIELT